MFSVGCRLRLKKELSTQHRLSQAVLSVGYMLRPKKELSIENRGWLIVNVGLRHLAISISIIPAYDNSMTFYSRPVAKKWTNRTVCFRIRVYFWKLLTILTLHGQTQQTYHKRRLYELVQNIVILSAFSKFFCALSLEYQIRDFSDRFENV
jgi:hypothetical protein